MDCPPEVSELVLNNCDLATLLSCRATCRRLCSVASGLLPVRAKAAVVRNLACRPDRLTYWDRLATADVTTKAFATACAENESDAARAIARRYGVKLGGNRGAALLGKACSKGYTNVVRVLFEFGATAGDARPLLRIAYERRRYNIIRLILESGATVSDDRIRDLLGNACTYGHSGLAKVLFECGYARMALESKDMICNALRHKQHTLAKLFFDYGLTADGVRAANAVRSAVRGARATVEMLFEKGITLEDIRTCHAMEIAVQHGQTDTIELLFDKGVTVEDARTCKAMRHTSNRGRLDALELLFDKGFPAEDARNCHALCQACVRGRADIVELLFRNGITVEDAKACNMLGAACAAGKVDVVKQLSRLGLSDARITATCPVQALIMMATKSSSYCWDMGVDVEPHVKTFVVASLRNLAEIVELMYDVLAADSGLLLLGAYDILHDAGLLPRSCCMRGGIPCGADAESAPGWARRVIRQRGASGAPCDIALLRWLREREPVCSYCASAYEHVDAFVKPPTRLAICKQHHAHGSHA